MICVHAVVVKNTNIVMEKMNKNKMVVQNGDNRTK